MLVRMRLLNETSLKRLRFYIQCVAGPILLGTLLLYGLAVITSPSGRMQREDWIDLAILSIQPFILALILWLFGELIAYRKSRQK